MNKKHKKRIIVLVDDKIHREFKILAAKRKETMTSILEKHIKQFVAKS